MSALARLAAAALADEPRCSGRTPRSWATRSPNRNRAAGHITPDRCGRRRLQRPVDCAARQRTRPDRDVVPLEARTVGWAASGATAASASQLTHGHANGVERWPTIAELERLGHGVLDRIAEAVARYGIVRIRTHRCHHRRHRRVAAPRSAKTRSGCGTATTSSTWMPPRCGPSELGSYLGGIYDRDVRPCCTRQTRRLREACLRLGVRIFEHPGAGDPPEPGRLRLESRHGRAGPQVA